MSQVLCLNCKKEYYARPSLLKIGRNRFCSNKCKGEANRIKSQCGNCKKELIKLKVELKRSKRGILFCNSSCAATYNNKLYHWKNHKWTTKTGYRPTAIKLLGLICNSKEDCPLKDLKLPSFMYEVDHIDGNHWNNDPANWQILCIWCHRIKTYRNGDLKKKNVNKERFAIYQKT